MPEGQEFCFNCWLGLPASVAYKLLDTDAGRRAIAQLEAEAYLMLQAEKARA